MQIHSTLKHTSITHKPGNEKSTWLSQNSLATNILSNLEQMTLYLRNLTFLFCKVRKDWIEDTRLDI